MSRTHDALTRARTGQAQSTGVSAQPSAASAELPGPAGVGSEHFARCPVCGCDVHLMHDGTLAAHGRMLAERAVYCAGGRKPPA